MAERRLAGRSIRRRLVARRRARMLSVRSKRIDRRYVGPVVVAAAGLPIAVLTRESGWILAGLLVGALLVRQSTRRRVPARVRRERAEAAAGMPFALDLVAAVLRTGAPLDRAVAVVGAAVNGPVGAYLLRVADAIRGGREPGAAWAPIGELPDGQRVVTAAYHSMTNGTACATAFNRVAEEMRSSRVVAVEAAASRSNVLMVLPLGLCFLPAFMLVGVVPAAVSLLVNGFATA